MKGNVLNQGASTSVAAKGSRVDMLLFWSFCCTFFFIPVATSPAIIAGGFSLAVWIFSGKFIKDRDRWLNQDWTKPVVLFMLLPLVGLLWTGDMATGLKFAKKSYYWLYPFAIASIYRDGHTRILIRAFLAGLTLTAVAAILQKTGVIPMTKGYAAGYMSHISYSLLLVFGLLLLSFYFRRTKHNRNKIYLSLLMLVYLFSLSVNIGRIGYLAFVIVSPWILYNILGQKHVLKITAAALAGIAVLSFSSTVQERTRKAVNEVKLYYNGSKATSIGLRLHMWNGAIKIILKKPFIGVGTGGYKQAMKKYMDDPKLPDFVHPHNSFLHMAVSYGIVGLSSFIWLLAVFIKKGWKSRDTIEGFSVLSFGIVLIIGSMTDTQILSVATGMMFALLTGIQINDRSVLRAQ